eukprot:11177918-Alexandrium_andersonii.AAC.1
MQARDTSGPWGRDGDAPGDSPVAPLLEAPAPAEAAERVDLAGPQDTLAVDPVAIAVPADEALDGETELTQHGAPPGGCVEAEDEEESCR